MGDMVKTIMVLMMAIMAMVKTLMVLMMAIMDMVKTIMVLMMAIMDMMETIMVMTMAIKRRQHTVTDMIPAKMVMIAITQRIVMVMIIKATTKKGYDAYNKKLAPPKI